MLPRASGRCPAAVFCFRRLVGRRLGPLTRLALEHFEHAVGDDEATHDVEGGEEHGEEPEDQLARPVRFAHDDERADQHDPVDGVRARHKRRVQDAGDLGHDLDPHEDRKGEDGQEGDDPGVRTAARGRLHDEADHDCVPPVPPSISTAAGAIAVPSRRTHMPVTISSSQSGASDPSGPISAKTFATFRANRKLAWVGMPDGGLVIPTMCTSLWSTISPAFVSSQLPPWSAAMSTTTAPGAMPSTIDVVRSTGALRPGTAAVVITTSERPTSSASAARWRSSSSGVSSRA